MKIVKVKKQERRESIYDQPVHDNAVEYAAWYIGTKTCPHRTIAEPLPCPECLQSIQSDLDSYVRRRLITQKKEAVSHAKRTPKG